MAPKPRMVRKNAPTSTTMPGPSTMAAMTSNAPPSAPSVAPGSQVAPSVSATLSTGRTTPAGVSPSKGLSTATNTKKSSPMAASSSKGSPMAVNGKKGSPMSKSMPPPPAPAAPKAILESEVDAMSRAFRTAAVKTGQIYGFYADTARLGIQNYAPSPPAFLTTGLAQHVQQYDQLCDRVEAHLLRAIAVLQRDLQRERAADEEARMVVVSPGPQPQLDISAPPPTVGLTGAEISPPLSAGGINQTTPGRRPSTISLSSLNRPQFAHKLDLLDSTLHLSPESLSAAAAATGIDAATLASMGRPPSPVTLAPKSARALELGSEFMGLLESAGASSSADRPVDIDLTLDDDVPVPGVGGSADQPIELDLDMDLFGDATSSMPEVPVKKEPGSDGLDLDILNSLAPKDDNGTSGADLLAQLGQSGVAGGSNDFNLDMSTLPNMNMDVSGDLNMDLGMESGMDLSQGGGMNLDEGAGMDVGMDMNLDFSGVPLSDVDFSGVPGGEGVDMLDMDALLGSGSAATGDGTGSAEAKDGGAS